MQHRPTGVRGIVFGGIMAALFLVCALIPFLNLFMPIPLVLAYVRFGGRVAFLSAMVSVLFVAMFQGPIPATLLVPAGVLPGLVFGYGFRHKLKPLTLGILAVLIFFLGSVATYLIYRFALYGGKDPIEMMFASGPMKDLFEQVFSMVEKNLQPPANASPQQIAALEQQRKVIEDIKQNPVATAWVILPSSLFLGGCINTWLNYSISRWILPRFGHEVPAATPFREFRLPTWLIWVFALVTFGLTRAGDIQSVHAAPWWVQMLLNVVLPLQYIFVLAGAAVAYGFMRKKQISKPLAVVITVMVAFMGALGQQLMVMLAMWDTIFDFRGLGHGVWKRPTQNP